MYLGYNAVAIEDLGKPVVMTCHQMFINDATSAAQVKGLPGLRIVTTLMPGHQDNLDIIREALTDEVMDKMVAALTKPLTAEEKSPKPREEVVEPWKVVFKGNLQEVNTFFYRRGWSGGSPIVPPTEEAVREMLTGTDLPADHVVAKTPVRYGKATVQKIAVNAVMAGCLPTHMPILIAGTQCLVDEPYTRHVDHALVSMVSGSPGWLIHGPIRNDLNVNSGHSLLSPETIANAAIARAMGLIIKNIGGIRPGVEGMSQYGAGGRYRVAFAENEEDSPWEPLHVEKGLKKEDSAVSLFFTGGGSILVTTMNFDATDKDFIGGLCNSVVGTGMMLGGGILVIAPDIAQFLADNGWTKKKIISAIEEEIKRVPARRMSEKMEYPKGHFDWLAPLEDRLRIVVAGAPGLGNAGGYYLSGGMAGLMTKKVELPANWANLVKKYKLVPAYPAQY